MASRRDPVHLSGAEWKVMHCVWEADTATARDVRDALVDDTDWAYTTVKTMMTRLVDKGALWARMRGNTTHFTPRITQEDARHSAVRALMDRAFDGTAGSLLHFLVEGRKLSRKERAALRDLLEGER